MTKSTGSVNIHEAIINGLVDRLIVPDWVRIRVAYQSTYTCSCYYGDDPEASCFWMVYIDKHDERVEICARRSIMNDTIELECTDLIERIQYSLDQTIRLFINTDGAHRGLNAT